MPRALTIQVWPCGIVPIGWLDALPSLSPIGPFVPINWIPLWYWSSPTRSDAGDEMVLTAVPA